MFEVINPVTGAMFANAATGGATGRSGVPRLRGKLGADSAGAACPAVAEAGRTDRDSSAG